MLDLACPCCGYKPEVRERYPSLADARRMVEQVARRHEITVDEILSPDRSRRLILPRWHAFSELRRIGFSYPSIGKIMGRDHSTVIHGIRKFAEMEG